MIDFPIQPEEVQYMGIPGHSVSCCSAVDTIVNSENPPRKASLVTWLQDRTGFTGLHLFLFWDWNRVRLTVVHSGFASGYTGGGPHNFSIALSMIRDREIPMSNIFLTEHQFHSIENRRLTVELIEQLRSADDGDVSWADIYPRHSKQVEAQTFWPRFHQPKMSFDHMKPEISQRCRNLYAHDPEAAISRAFTVIEERLRELLAKSSSDVQNLHANELITKAFHIENGALTDKSLPRSEREGLLLLFKGAFQYVRNPRAHRLVNESDEQLSIDFMHVADMLLRILPNPESQDGVQGDLRS